MKVTEVNRIIIPRACYKLDTIPSISYIKVCYSVFTYTSELDIIVPILEMRKMELVKIKYFIKLSGRPRFWSSPCF